MDGFYREFWTDVYVAAVRAGSSSYMAARMADEALAALKEREGK